MADNSERVMEMVRREIAKNPGVKSGPLYEKAKKLDRSMRSLSLRQFHARYPLQVKRAEKHAERVKPSRKKSPAKTAGRPGRKPGRPSSTLKTASKKRAPRTAGTKGAGRKSGSRQSTGLASMTARDAARRVLLDFAGEVANADNKSDMIAVIGRLDGWIDRLIAST